MKKIFKYSILSIMGLMLLASCDPNDIVSNLGSIFDSNINIDSNSNDISGDELSSSNNSIDNGNNSSNSSFYSSVNDNNNTSNDVISGTKTDSVTFINYSGHLESAYVEFYPVKNATGYNAYYKLSTDSKWVQIDTELIRYYGDYYRVDALGLKEGNYKLKVTPIISNKESSSKGNVVDLYVKKHQREGYAFVDKPVKNAFGAYNDDGTLRSGAQVIYVTKDNAKTVTASINGNTITGFQSIIDAMQKKQDLTDVINFRIIGTIDINDLDHYSSSAEGLQIKGKGAHSNMNLTLEGVGNDATFFGFGILIRNCANVEIRNLGFINYLDDGISIDTDNKNLWVHNNDLFYGQAGGASDQAKGDGALDTKKSSHITHSYNHFWDTGKTNLQGMTSESSDNLITYHHNWFDHSDSRHPRVRTCTVHVFNNFYDCNSKYGIGATMGASIYAEGNYFYQTKYPMLISLQGSDMIGGKGTFSSETGGMIKAYDNYIARATAFVSYEQNNTDFDAYVAKTRDEKVPNSVKTKSGSNTYSNFDTASNFYSYTYESPSQAKETTTSYAGRVDGGDFKWTFSSSDATSYAVDANLKNALNSYKSSLVSVGGNSIEGSVDFNVNDVIELIDKLDDKVTLDNIDEIKAVYETYLSFDKNEVTNSSKIERLYKEALALEIEQFKTLVDLLDSSLTKTNIDNALNYYNLLNESQQKEVSSYKTKLDNKVKEYENIASTNVSNQIASLPSIDKITLSDEENINNIKSDYDSLTSEQKSEVKNYSILESAIKKIEELKIIKSANEFIEKVNNLPSNTSNLSANDLKTIEALISEYNSFSNEIKAYIDSTYINKLNIYKDYINSNLITNTTVSITLSDLDGNKGTTSNGFEYETNGSKDEHIKLKGNNHITYNVNTSNISLVLVANCLDSSNSKDFTITITYSNGNSDVYTYQTDTGNKDKTYNLEFNGDITSITINGPSDKNLGVKSLELTYSK